MTPAEFSSRMRKAQRALPVNLKAALADTQKEGKRQAIVFSSGGMTPAGLRRAGHPYSKRAPNAAYDPGIVNRGKGVFIASWRTPAVLVTADGMTASLINVDPNAAYLKSGPNSSMIVHTPSEKIMAAVQPERMGRTRAAVEKSFYRPG